MEFKTYVQNIVATYVEKQNRKAIFIKHYNTLDISREEMLAYVKDPQEEIFLYHEYDMNVMHAAYEPFLEWIRQCYDQFYKHVMPAEDFLRECHVYHMHIEPLACFINDAMCKRNEDVLYIETEYETQQMFQSLIGILEFISQEHSLTFILSKFHLAPYSTIQLVKQILGEAFDIHVIVMYNDVFFIPDYKKGIWEELLSDVIERNIQLEWGSLDSQKTIDTQDDFWFDKHKTKEYFLKLVNMYHTFALQDAYYYMSDVTSKLEGENTWLSKEENIQFLQLAALIDMGMGQANQALVICDRMFSLYTSKDDSFTDYMYYYISARARMILSQLEHVRKYCAKCIEIAGKLGDDLLEYKAEILLWSAYYDGWKDIFHYDFRYKADRKLIEKTKTFGFQNFLAYLYVFGFENDPDSIRAIALGEKQPEYFNLGIQIGKALGNENFLLMAYMKNIILYSEAGYYHYVRKMYEKRLAVLKRPNRYREAHMLAGLGYNSIILEDYEKAHEYLTKSICNLTELEKADDIMDSLYNLAMSYFTAEAYENVIEVINLIMKMLDEVGYQAIRVCSTSKLYGMLAISCYYQKEYYNSYYYLSKIEVVIEHLLNASGDVDERMWEEDLFLYHLIKGMLYDYEMRFELCQKELDLARKYMLLTSGDMFYILPLFALEQAAIYQKKQMKEEAHTILLEAIAFCEKEGFDKKKKKLQDFLEYGIRQSEPLVANKVQLPVQQIMQVAKHTGTQNKLKRREKDIEFLTILQELISKEKLTVEELFINTTAILKNSFNLDDIVILRKETGKQSILNLSESVPLDEAVTNQIFAFFRTYKQAFLTNRFDKNFMQFMPVMQYFDVQHIVTMIGIPIIEESGVENIFLAYVNMQQNFNTNRILLNGDNLLILKFAFSQFCGTLRRIDNRMTIEHMNQKLEQSAITDYLTGITNRKGFSMQMEELCAQDNYQSNAILYLDLDNFKYYNDTFGHDIGDLVLVGFADLFKRLTAGRGLPVRYGGDEFIILLPGQSEKDGAYLAEQVYQEIEDGFQEEISKKLNKQINISKDKRISCSIGIASFQEGSKEALERALNQADQALYYVKKHGKGTYMVASSVVS